MLYCTPVLLRSKSNSLFSEQVSPSISFSVNEAKTHTWIQAGIPKHAWRRANHCDLKLRWHECCLISEGLGLSGLSALDSHSVKWELGSFTLCMLKLNELEYELHVSEQYHYPVYSENFSNSLQYLE